MSFVLAELVIESVLRDGFADMFNTIGTDNDQIDDIFSSLTEPFLNKYYGEKELQKIKQVVKDGVNIVHGYGIADQKKPSVVINLVGNPEEEQYAALDDFVQEQDVEIDPKVLVGPLTADSYNSVNGVVDVTTADPDLSSIRVRHIFVDGAGNKFPIVGGITNDTGDKRFSIASRKTITDLTGTKVQTLIDKARRIQRGVRETENIMLTISSVEPLLTKYLYMIVKFILLSRKSDLLSRCIDLTSLDGSDFARAPLLSDQVYVRFITIRSRFVEQSWLAENVTLVDIPSTIVRVPRGIAKRDDEETLGVQTSDDC